MKKTNLYKIFIIISILICIFLFPFVHNMTSKFPDAYPGSEATSGVITFEIANQISIYVWPILISYLIMLISLIKKNTNYKKVYYPLSLLTLTIIFLNIGIIYYGYMILWYLIILFFPLIIFLFFLAILGKTLDNKNNNNSTTNTNTLTPKTIITILVSTLLITIIILISSIITTGNNFEENVYDNKKSEIQNNNYEKNKNRIKKEFNNLLDTNFISVNTLKLSKDYNTIDTIELLIVNDTMYNNEIDFCNAIIESYNNIKILLNKYNYTSQNIGFKFSLKNPFAKETSTFYHESGSISDRGSLYLIYLNPTPVEISK